MSDAITKGMEKLSLSTRKRKASAETPASQSVLAPSAPKRKKKFGRRLEIVDVTKKKNPRTVDIITYLTPIDDRQSFYLETLSVSPTPSEERQVLVHAYVRSSESSSADSSPAMSPVSSPFFDPQAFSEASSGDETLHTIFSQPPASPDATVPCVTLVDRDAPNTSDAVPSVDLGANAVASTSQHAVVANTCSSAAPLDSGANVANGVNWRRHFRHSRHSRHFRHSCRSLGL